LLRNTGITYELQDEMLRKHRNGVHKY